MLGLVPSSWAEPCVPLAGPTGPPMGVYMVPPIGRRRLGRVRAGRPDVPDLGRLPLGRARPTSRRSPTLGPARSRPNIVLQTAGQNSLVISDLPGPTGGIMLKSATGATLIVNDTGIYIQNGKGASIVMTGPTVNVNHGALTVV